MSINAPPFEETMAFLRNAPPPGEYSRIETEKREAARAFAKSIQQAFKTLDEPEFTIREREVKKKQIVSLLDRFAGKPCPYCHLPMGPHGRFPTRDHIHPRSLGGKNTASNLMVVCRPCNGEKGNLTLEQFAALRVSRGDKRADFILSLLGQPAAAHKPPRPSKKRKPAPIKPIDFDRLREETQRCVAGWEAARAAADAMPD